MQSAYFKKNEIKQRSVNNPTASVLDSSSQSESLQRKADMTNNAAQRAEAPRPNNTGMPDNLKSGIESLSGFSMDDVRVHYNSSKPATVQALAYTQGTDIHVAPGQEKHLPHEAWHVAQQMAGRVSPTTNINGMPVNDNAGLEHEADVMGEKAVQRKLGNTSVSLLKNQTCNSIMQLTTREDSEDLDRKLSSSEDGDLVPRAHSTNTAGEEDADDDDGGIQVFFQTMLRSCDFDEQDIADLIDSFYRIINSNKHLKKWYSDAVRNFDDFICEYGTIFETKVTDDGEYKVFYPQDRDLLLCGSSKFIPLTYLLHELIHVDSARKYRASSRYPVTANYRKLFSQSHFSKEGDLADLENIRENIRRLCILYNMEMGARDDTASMHIGARLEYLRGHAFSDYDTVLGDLTFFMIEKNLQKTYTFQYLEKLLEEANYRRNHPNTMACKIDTPCSLEKGKDSLDDLCVRAGDLLVENEECDIFDAVFVSTDRTLPEAILGHPLDSSEVTNLRIKLAENRDCLRYDDRTQSVIQIIVDTFNLPDMYITIEWSTMTTCYMVKDKHVSVAPISSIGLPVIRIQSTNGVGFKRISDKKS